MNTTQSPFGADSQTVVVRLPDIANEVMPRRSDMLRHALSG